ncbi:MAG: MoaD/ThiS family protein [Firmicutes bacterium]|nr:MoaD/ThiS family protein [Bacillota bacterium]
MAVRVRIPVLMRNLTGGESQVTAEGRTVAEVFSDLDRRFPGVKERVYDEEGKLRRFINVYVNEKDIREMQGEETPLADGDEVAIVPAIAGGGPKDRSSASIDR